MSVRLSKFLSLVLRHQPERIGITLDKAGWTSVVDLLAACAKHGVAITRPELEALVAASDKQRYAFTADKSKIRANQGHSIAVDLGLVAITPPELLFHGTTKAAAISILESGIHRGSRHHVHLSGDRETATKVGSRRGAPVILVVHAAVMAAAGYEFYRSDNDVWLTEHVPVEYIDT